MSLGLREMTNAGNSGEARRAALSPGRGARRNEAGCENRCLRPVPPAADPAGAERIGPAAFGQWSEQQRPRLIRLAYRFLRNTQDAEDAVQNALMLTWQRIRQRRAPRNCAAWLHRITVNESLRRLRRRSFVPLAEEAVADQSSGTSDRVESRELADRVRIALSNLPVHRRVALLLRDLEGLKYEQIAVMIETGPGAVRLLVHRARRATRSMCLRRWPDAFDN